ncbi:MAG: isochorismate synthase, partial [Acidimicrobiia bacterium]|nr:isochorismate synthase [Acidimicrobiia bacterium]
MLFTDTQLASLAAQFSNDPSQLRTASIAVECDPLSLVRAGSELFARSSFFRAPAGEEVGSLGVAVSFDAAGTDRFANLEAELCGLPELTDGARIVLGFSFNPEGPSDPEWDGFASADAVLPAVCITKGSSGGRLVVAVPSGADADRLIELLGGLIEPDEPPPPDPGAHNVESVPSTVEWQSEVAEAVGAIDDGSIQKVVLARSVRVDSERATDPYGLVHHLAIANPSCYIYSVVVGESAFVGASPELLLAQQGREIWINPLAGSARRGKGADDVAVGDELLSSAKNRGEHAIVVDDLVARLGQLTERIEYPDGPQLRRMATVQHLSTEIDGTLCDGVSTFDVLASIHPTPAVGGTPRAEALAFIDKAELIDRGWYSGGVGWVDPGGGAQVALALRCALITGVTSRLYAGNGIV